MTDPNAIASGVKVIDDNTISLTIGAPNADFVSDLTDPSAFIVPQHILKDTDPKAVETIEFSTTKPIGTGPYKFVKYETDQYSQFEANPDYFQGAPKIKNIFVKRLLGDQAIAQLESGDLDLSDPAQPGRAGAPREGADPRRALDLRRRDLWPVHEPAHADRREDP